MSEQDGPIRVFVGGMREHLLPFKVLEYSIRVNTREPVEVIPLWECVDDSRQPKTRKRTDGGPIIKMPLAKDRRNQGATSFSFHRWLIPELIGFKGRGIYLDSDMLVCGDIAELWRVEMPQTRSISPTAWKSGTWAVTTPGWQTAVMVIDGEIGWRIKDITAKLDAGEWSYGAFMNGKYEPRLARTVDPLWDCTDEPLKRDRQAQVRRPQGCRLYHFTSMNTQPWLWARHPLGRWWEEHLMTALVSHDIDLTPEDVRYAVRKKFVRPSLLQLFGEHPPYPDSEFVMPHKRR